MQVLNDKRVTIRSDRGTRVLVLSAPVQWASIALLSAAVAWTGIATVLVARDAADRAVSEFQGQSEKTALAARLSGHEATIAALELQREAAEARVGALEAAIARKQGALIDLNTALSERDLALTNSLRDLEVARGTAQSAASRIARRDDEISALKIELSATDQRISDLDSAVTELTARMDAVIRERDTAFALVEGMDVQIASLSEALRTERSRKDYLMASLEGAADTSQTTISKMFTGTGLDLDSVLRETLRDYSGRGGPDNPEDDLSALPSFAEPEDMRMASLVDDLERLSMMRVAVDRAPFGKPTSGARITSGFGPRRDPVRRTYRRHNGIDFAAPRGTPIYATGDGVVSFSGRQSGYGIVVKIRHAFGFETVYAHLNKSHVKVGQRVSRADRIADMGSTGRSTGTHLHYEVRIDGKPVNPATFLKAGNNVL